MSTLHLAVLIIATPTLASLAALAAPLFASHESKQLQGFAAAVSVTRGQLGSIAESAVLSRPRASIEETRSKFQSMTVPSAGENIPGAGQ
jgi:hypothetical protein